LALLAAGNVCHPQRKRRPGKETGKKKKVPPWKARGTAKAGGYSDYYKPGGKPICRIGGFIVGGTRKKGGGGRVSGRKIYCHIWRHGRV